jgi:hypothetical protein
LELAAADATSRAAAIAARAAAADTDVTFTDAADAADPDAALGCCGALNGTALGRAGDFTGAFPGGAKR